MLRVVGNELFFYDAIGPSDWGHIDTGEVVDALAKLQNKRVIARINSPGGSVDEGVAIHNALRRHPGGCEVVVDAVAASIASVIAMAGSKIVMASGARMMIHEPWTFAMGNSQELRKQANTLDTYSDALVEIYAKRTKKSPSEIKSLLANETWLSASEAVAGKFADSVEK